MKANVEYIRLSLDKAANNESLFSKFLGFSRSYGSYGRTYDNWDAIYKLNNDELILILVATGTHEIFDQ
ncbi:hypothetical protein [Companilactobacillus nantensis]|uniref:hypothetical protein n=1 Tax=Companilactobacillus nantensis TaxID=305793 RepID=UPI000AC2F541|nr:hypothetical protein [Companilactobacillus nantensis]GEO65229.1 hypothetical protein LNA01_24120 [Companilactobacillus nantensis]